MNRPPPTYGTESLPLILTLGFMKPFLADLKLLKTIITLKKCSNTPYVFLSKTHHNSHE